MAQIGGAGAGTVVDKGTKSTAESFTLDQRRDSQSSIVGGSGSQTARIAGTHGQVTEAGGVTVQTGGGLGSKSVIKLQDPGAMALASDALAYGFTHLIESSKAQAEGARSLASMVGGSLASQTDAVTAAMARQTQTAASDLQRQLWSVAAIVALVVGGAWFFRSN